MEEVQNRPEQQEEQPKSRKPRNKFVRFLINRYFLVTLVFVVLILFVDRNNIIRWAGDCVEVIQQERIIRQYDRDIQALDEKLNELTSDKDSLEKFAREQYYFHEKDEDVFIVD